MLENEFRRSGKGDKKEKDTAYSGAAGASDEEERGRVLLILKRLFIVVLVVVAYMYFFSFAEQTCLETYKENKVISTTTKMICVPVFIIMGTVVPSKKDVSLSDEAYWKSRGKNTGLAIKKRTKQAFNLKPKPYKTHKRALMFILFVICSYILVSYLYKEILKK